MWYRLKENAGTSVLWDLSEGGEIIFIRRLEGQAVRTKMSYSWWTTTISYSEKLDHRVNDTKRQWGTEEVFESGWNFCSPLVQIKEKENSFNLKSSTDVVVGLPLEETGLVTSWGSFDGGCELTEVRLCDVQRKVSSRSQFHMRPPLVVLCKQDKKPQPQRWASHYFITRFMPPRSSPVILAVKGLPAMCLSL